MEVTFRRDDLLPEHRDLPTSQVKAEHLNRQARLVLELVGKATYRSGYGNNSSYNAVFSETGVSADDRRFLEFMTGNDEATVEMFLGGDDPNEWLGD